MFAFINNYRNAVKESISNRDYTSAIARTVAFPLFYASAALTDVVFNAFDVISGSGKNDNKAEAEEKTIEYRNADGKRVVESWYTGKDGAQIHSIATFDEPVTIDIDPEQEEILKKAFATAMKEVRHTGKPVTLGDVLNKVA